jgi:hypothetical protein
MKFSRNLHELFPVPNSYKSDRKLDVDWAKLEELFPNFALSSSRDPKGSRHDDIKSLEQDYLTWTKSQEDFIPIDVEHTHHWLTFPVRGRSYPNYSWIDYPANALLNKEGRRAAINDGFCDNLIEGPGTTVSEVWAVAFSQIPETILYDLSNIKADLIEILPMRFQAEGSAQTRDWNNKVTLLNVVAKLKDFSLTTWMKYIKSSEDLTNALKTDSAKLGQLFSYSSLGVFVEDKKVPVRIQRALLTLVVDLYDWISAAGAAEHTFSLEHGDSRNKVCHSLHEVAAQWVITNGLTNASLPRLPEWKEYVNCLTMVQNAILDNRGERKADCLADAFQHAVFCHSAPNPAFWNWLQTSSPIYRLLAFS